jgi:hypothetical protein
MIYTVTITGADDTVHPKALSRFQKRYPFVEWGILLSRSNKGAPRFPSLEWLRSLKSYSNELRLSGHICGSLIKDLLHGRDIFKDELSEWLDIFDRFQLNFHGIPTDVTGEELATVLKNYPNKEFIFQYDNINNSFMEKSLQEGMSVSALFDLSHGTGVLPDEWNKPLKNVNCGYAGGLGPDNLFEQISRIEKLTSGISYWIDMESRVRSNNDQLFDMEKVSRCLKIAEDFITSSPVLPCFTWLRYPKSLKEFSLKMNEEKENLNPEMIAAGIDKWVRRNNGVPGGGSMQSESLYCKCQNPTGYSQYICLTCGGTSSRAIAEGI